MTVPVFEYDGNKSRSNLSKHGIDFVRAQQLWQDENRLVFPIALKGEERLLMIAELAGKHWAAIYTLRGDSIRIISVRRARMKEVELYEN